MVTGGASALVAAIDAAIDALDDAMTLAQRTLDPSHPCRAQLADTVIVLHRARSAAPPQVVCRAEDP
jgi:hypothetical protein